MRTMEMSEEINQQRRRSFVAEATTTAAVQLGMIGSAHAQAGKTKPLDAVGRTRNTGGRVG
jgi:hypothetical protein